MKALTTKDLRNFLSVHKSPSVQQALFLAGLDIALYILFISGAIMLENLAGRIACSLLAGMVIASLFVIGHDAAHDAYTPHRWLNRVIARIVFLPSLHNFGLWLTEHNRIHHQSTNVRELDSWSPFSKAEYEALPAWRQWLERFYRSVPGIGFYYLIERWWKNKFYPYRKLTGKYNSVYADFTLVITCFSAYTALLIYLGMTLSHTNPLELILLALIVPFMVWNYMMGFTVYQHHTHETIGWACTRTERDSYGTQEDFTMHVRYPRWYNHLSHNIMEHPAHHVDPRIPCYHLADAQATLERLAGERIRVIEFSVAGFLETLRKCKLYDYDRHCWLDFSGNVTSQIDYPKQQGAIGKAA